MNVFVSLDLSLGAFECNIKVTKGEVGEAREKMPAEILISAHGGNEPLHSFFFSANMPSFYDFCDF